MVPARGGSKSIPGKNLCQVGGISLVGRAARVATSLDWVDKAVLSTDDVDIAQEGKRCGLDVPFMRPEELAGDLSTSVDMWRHAWIESERHYGMVFDLSILLEPTSPLRQSEDIKLTVNALINGDHQAAATVSRAPAHFTPHKCLTVDQQGLIGFYLKDGAQYSLRQKIPAYYFRNGICYAARRMTVVEKGQILEKRCKAVVIDRPIVNIDEPFDLELAEFLLKKNHSISRRVAEDAE
ncbi:MAG: acylneuraminate cytidylyltransferase family protein [Deltaproteobacteria bacterium]|nr:acylneuraminate cytidylyltransferase family protein [Deltaproteobacteria bacterium]